MKAGKGTAQKEIDPVIEKLGYKDILIILALWYFMAFFIILTKEIGFSEGFLNDFFHFLFILAGRFIYLAVVLFYLTSLYSLSFKELGLRFREIKKQLITGVPPVIFLLAAVLLLINVPASYTAYRGFSPLIKINSPEALISSLFPLLLLFPACYLIALCEQFLLGGIVFKLFNNTLFNRFFSLILASLFYSIILLDFEPGRILVNFLSALISLIILQRTGSLLSSSIFTAGYYTAFILYLYGWDFIIF